MKDASNTHNSTALPHTRVGNPQQGAMVVLQASNGGPSTFGNGYHPFPSLEPQDCNMDLWPFQQVRDSPWSGQGHAFPQQWGDDPDQNADCDVPVPMDIDDDEADSMAFTQGPSKQAVLMARDIERDERRQVNVQFFRDHARDFEGRIRAVARTHQEKVNTLVVEHITQDQQDRYEREMRHVVQNAAAQSSSRSNQAWHRPCQESTSSVPHTKLHGSKQKENSKKLCHAHLHHGKHHCPEPRLCDSLYCMNHDFNAKQGLVKERERDAWTRKLLKSQSKGRCYAYLRNGEHSCNSPSVEGSPYCTKHDYNAKKLGY